MGEHHPGRTVVDRRPRLVEHGAQVMGAHIGGGDVRERPGVQADVPAHHGEQALTGGVVRAGVVAVRVLGHEDGAAEGEHRHGAAHGRSISSSR
jgi:hypothetical protein